MKKLLAKKLLALTTLFFVSPIVSELLFGSTPLSRAAFLLPQAFFYGSGCILIREIFRGYHMSWGALLLLGTVFGIIEEALALQSVFNPKFFGLDLSYGRYFGVNWLWGIYIIGYHAFYSITLPIVITELLFPTIDKLRWTHRYGLGASFLVFIAMTVSFYFIFNEQSEYTTPALPYALAVIAAFCLTILAFLLPRKESGASPSFSLSPLFVALLSVLFCGAWLWLFAKIFEPDPWSVGSLLASAILLALILSIVFPNSIHRMSSIQRFALAAGGLLVSMVFGLQVLMAVGNRLDIVAHIIFMSITTILLTLLARVLTDKRRGTMAYDER